MTEEEKETLIHLLEKFFRNEFNCDIYELSQPEIGYPISCLLDRRKRD